MTKLIKSIKTIIQSEEIGHIIVEWDLAHGLEEPDKLHPDTTSYYGNYVMYVNTLHSVKYLLFDKKEIEITETIKKDYQLMSVLERRLLSSIEDNEFEGIENNEMSYF